MLLFLILFMVTIALLISEKSPSKILQIEDEDEAYHYDIQKEKLYGLATILKVSWSCHTFSRHLL